MNVEAYIQFIIPKKTVETISFDRRRGFESVLNAEESWERTSLSVILGAEMHKQPTPPSKPAENEEVGVKQINSQNIISLILDGLTTVKEPTININKNSDLEEDNEVVKMAEKMIQK